MEPEEYALMDAAESHMWWYRALHERILAALDGVSGRVLDAGCGTGGLLTLLRSKRPDLERVGLEWDGMASRQAAAKSAAPVVRGSVNTLPFANACFDAAIAADVLCHAAVAPETALAELHRVLRPGGRLVVNMPAYRWLLSEHDRRVHNARRMTAGQTRRLVATAGFDTVRAQYWNGLLLPLMVVHRRVPSRRKTSDVAVFPPWLDGMLHGMTVIERLLPFPMPAGGSILVTAERP